MRYLICYDIQEQKIRTKVAKLLEKRAYRVKYSVFWAEFTEREAKALQEELLARVAKAERPLLLMTPVCAACAERIWQVGKRLEEAQDFVVV